LIKDDSEKLFPHRMIDEEERNKRKDKKITDPTLSNKRKIP
jgi:hypothetical protein